MNGTGKHLMDVGAVGAAIGSVLHWMPEVAALLSAIWMVIRFIEMGIHYDWSVRVWLTAIKNKNTKID